jgi:CxxC motif-containing protein
MTSVRLTERVPRDMVFPILKEIAKLRPAAPIRRGDILIPNVFGTSVDVIATRTVL